MDNGAEDNPVILHGVSEGHMDSSADSAGAPKQPASPADADSSQETAAVPDERSALPARLNPSNDVELYVYEDKTDLNQDGTALVDVASLDLELEDHEGLAKQQISLKSEQGRLLLLLPPAHGKSFTTVEWEELCQQLKGRLSSENRFFEPNTTVHLIAHDRLLDSRQLQEIDKLLQTAELRMKRIYAQRRQTAVAAATAGYSVEQQTKLEHLSEAQNPGKALAPPLYLQTTVRSGNEIRHPGSIVVLGDINPGGTLIAAGDIFVWGRLRGVAHAGSEGNTACRIMALHMQPTQLRIADMVARSPEKPPASYQPEVAYVNGDGIRIAIASEFAQIHLNVP